MLLMIKDILCLLDSEMDFQPSTVMLPKVMPLPKNILFSAPFIHNILIRVYLAYSFAERTVYYYPDYTITPDQLVNHPLGLVTLAPIEGLCKTKAIDECTNECTRCQNECLYNMELHRSGSACNVKGRKVKIHAECPNKFWVEITKVTVCPNKYVICSEMFASEASNVYEKKYFAPKN